ncbi:MAG TPA: phosphoribosyltransferase family protein [Hanamia sp.]|nr:phosphoribosyltransferase family protein [Hanamia sp.]
MFHDRIEAGLQLAAKLKKFKNEPGVVLSVPRGGVPVAYIVAKELGFPMELILTKKISHPMNKEYAIGVASLTDYFIVPHEHVSQKYIEKELLNVRNRLKEMYKRFMGDKEPESLEGKTVIVIDDGIATGNTLSGTVNMLRKSKPGKIIIGVPVGSKDAVKKLSKEVDEVIAVIMPEEFHAVGLFYEDFGQVSDEKVILYLEKLKALRKA